ncbi:MAG: N-acetylglucosamine-6-phosphate deacetylase [Candidatus Acetothermia bacterium]|jgi:N-acetylglucosamine-6-phosphate deacetylase|nr:N-acetylglucosamine-6-phosphate deacetylase [Candidatus Acetothermia bacterium]
MGELLVRGGTLILGEPAEAWKGDLLARDGRIVRLDEGIQAPKGATELHAAGLYVAPGFIDLHVHGGGGADFMDAEPEAIRTIAAFHAAHGTTTLLAGILPAPADTMRRAMAAVSEAAPCGIAGVYLEGPFVPPSKPGALDGRWFLTPSPDAFRNLVHGHERLVKVVTLAPELPGADELLREVLAVGAVPAIGHTAATYEETMAALRHGARHFTHLWNAMSGLHHREPGPVGAALDADAWVELIVDGIHLHPATMRLAVKAKGFDRICLVTDAIGAAGLPDGDYALAGLPVHVHDGVARLADGTLAGSTLTMDRAVRNFMEFTGCSLPQAVRTASLTPARLLGIADRKGALEVGKDADIVVFDDNFNVHWTIIGGEIAYAREGGAGGDLRPHHPFPSWSEQDKP